MVPWHICLKFNQEVLIFFNGGHGLKLASSFAVKLQGGQMHDTWTPHLSIVISAILGS